VNRLITFIFILTFFSCNNSEPALNPEPQPEKHYSLVGEWEWIRSYCFWDVIYNPEITNNEITLSFKRNGKFIFVENTDTILQSNYFFIYEYSILFNEETDILYIESDSLFTHNDGFYIIPGYNRFFITYLTDTLHFMEADVYDGCEHRFKRKQN